MRSGRVAAPRVGRMAFLNELVVVAHLIGMAAIVGGYFATRSTRRIGAPIVWGARAQLVTGLILAVIAEMDRNDPPNHAKLGVKLLVAIAVVACAELANARQRKQGPSGEGAGSLLDAAAWLAVLNVAIAALWRSYS